ncbi:PaaI family thioesterase [Plastorhodobacter daqingensis]|uniref:PaaI family thioesterase n=1 Tax=Plastorhodobacter daqingensis TaxID=1387281 RepID=A0ABW2UDZ9_9RHOB
MSSQRIARSAEDLMPRARMLALSGLEAMQEMLAGRMPQPTIAGLLNYHLHSVEQDRVAFRGTPGFEHTNPFGTVHGGWYGTVLDSAMGCAVMTRVPRGHWYTTLEYKVNITRALPLGTEIEAVAEVLHAGRSTAVAEATIRDLDGKLFASGTTTCIILPG